MVAGHDRAKKRKEPRAGTPHPEPWGKGNKIFLIGPTVNRTQAQAATLEDE